MFDVEVADDVLTSQPNGFSEFPGIFSGWSGELCFLIKPLGSVSAGSGPELVNAARAAVRRFELVTSQGTELPGAWAVTDDDVPTGFVGPHLFEDGVVVGASGGDGISQAQGETLLKIVLDELRARELSARVSCPPAGLRVSGLPLAPPDGPHDDASPRPGQPETARWFIRRTVRTLTTTGVRYDEVEWLQANRTWSRNQAESISFADTEEDKAAAAQLVIALREEADAAGQDPNIGEVTAILTTPAAHARSHPMPPRAIRDPGHR